MATLQIRIFGQLAASIFATLSLPLNTAYGVDMGVEKTIRPAWPF